jgi:dihydrofolate reductase
MGRKTYDSLPNKPLPYRANIVISSNVDNDLFFEVKKDGSIFIRLDDAKKMLDCISKNPYPIDIYIIGGGVIYKELLPYCEKAYVTKINHSYDDVDTYFPNIDKMQNWELEVSSDIRNYNNTEYQFCLYRKRD